MLPSPVQMHWTDWNSLSHAGSIIIACHVKGSSTISVPVQRPHEATAVDIKAMYACIQFLLRAVIQHS